MKILLVIFLCSALFLQGVFCADLGSCNKPEDCGPGECCTIGMQRYSIPQCRKMGQEGSFCRQGNQPSDRVLYYPTEYVEMKGVYTMFCPCKLGLQCKGAKCSKP
uniref:U53-Liphistoxin-Lth1b_1 n=2 Tax=Liphistius TaxID=62150 RepID=A0A4Q8K2K5_9ARAC